LGEKRQVIKAVLIVAGRPKSISLSCAEEDTLEDNKEADLELKRLNNLKQLSLDSDGRFYSRSGE